MNLEEQKIKQELFISGLNAFNANKFYDAHEYWEDLWSDYRLKDPKFIQALIQLSVGYFHISNLNINGANGLLKKCLSKFTLYKPHHRGLDVNKIILSVDNSLNDLDTIKNINEFNWSLVPKLILDDSRSI
jgi:predicted metal-dependent hydrolase